MEIEPGLYPECPHLWPGACPPSLWLPQWRGEEGDWVGVGVALCLGIGRGKVSWSGCMGCSQVHEMCLGDHQWVEGPEWNPLEEGSLLPRGPGGQRQLPLAPEGTRSRGPPE